MSKIATISSLNRNAAKSEALFVSTINQVFEEANVERIAEFFDKLNIPRSVGAEDGLFEPIPDLINEASSTVWSFDDEKAISDGMQKFFNHDLGISDCDLMTVEWSLVAARLIELQVQLPFLTLLLPSACSPPW